MTTVLAGGDSFIWGSELADSPHGGDDGYSRNTFPALLSLGPYICAAYPGIGNKEIAQRVKNYLTWMNNSVFVLVCWTWATRDNETDSDCHITLLEEYLKYHQYKYLFTCADNCIITGKLDYSNWYFFPPGTKPQDTPAPRGFYQWAVENKYDCGRQHHPLESAHHEASILMQDKFNELAKKTY